MSRTTHTKVSPTTPRATKRASSSARGLSAIGDITTVIAPEAEAVRQAATVIPWLIKLTIGGIIAYVVWGKITNRFKALPTDSRYPQSNVSDAQAQSRASAIASSYTMVDFAGKEFETVSQNLAGLNYNGFIKVYNAFGHQTSHLLSGDLNLIEWINNQFSTSEVSQLSLLLGGAFF
jgi:hypothetical protein